MNILTNLVGEKYIAENIITDVYQMEHYEKFKLVLNDINSFIYRDYKHPDLVCMDHVRFSRFISSDKIIYKYITTPSSYKVTYYELLKDGRLDATSTYDNVRNMPKDCLCFLRFLITETPKYKIHLEYN